MTVKIVRSLLATIDYYDQLYGNKMDNLEELDRFLEKFDLSRLNKEEIEIMNNPIQFSSVQSLSRVCLLVTR